MHFFGSSQQRPVKEVPKPGEQPQNVISKWSQRKIELPPINNRIQEFDAQDLETYESFMAAPKVSVFLEPDNDRDLFVPMVDTVTGQNFVTRAITVNINAIQWIVPTGQKAEIPQPVYEFLESSPYQGRLLNTPPSLLGQNNGLGNFSRRTSTGIYHTA